VTTSTSRSRTITWHDPLERLSVAAGMSGMEFLTAIIEGTYPPPPIAATLGFTITKISEGKATFAGEPDESVYNPIGVVHGGYAMTMLDSAMACAVQTLLGPGERYTSLETKVNFVRAITLDTGPVRCDGEVVYRGGRIATAEGRLVAQADGKLLAHGTTTCLLIPREAR
jgi:uncharacterized protein (TIGR00369 family)